MLGKKLSHFFSIPFFQNDIFYKLINMRISVLFLVLSIAPFCEGMSRVSFKKEETGSYAVGVQTLEYVDEARNRPIVIELWYPTEITKEKAEPLRDAAFLERDSQKPLIVMSHGYGGSRQSQSWLAIEMARRGYWVASIEHYGSAKANFHPVLSLKFWDRFKDISSGISYLLGHFKSYLNENRIGFIGYSMGGMTGLGLAGAQAKNVRELILSKYHKHKDFNKDLFSQIDFTEGEKPYKDPRIKAMLLICPANFVYLPETFKNIKIPVGLVAAFHDEILPHKEHAHLLMRHLVPQKMKIIRQKITHSFLSPGPEFAADGGKIHSEVMIFALNFFSSNL
jgi:predicted dienelactone hydrolase